VLQPAGDLGLQQEATAADRVVAVAVEDPLQGHLAVQLGVQRHEDGAQAAFGMRPQDAEPLAVGGRGADGVAGGAIGVGLVLGRGQAGAGQAHLDVRVADASQALADGTAGREGGQALLGVTAVPLQVQGDHRLDPGPLLGVEVTAADEVLGQRAALIARPGGERREQRSLIDQAVLQRQHAEEQVARGVGGAQHGGRLPVEAIRVVGDAIPQVIGSEGVGPACSDERPEPHPHGRARPRNEKPRRATCRMTGPS
jgi:hypothetical protein